MFFKFFHLFLLIKHIIACLRDTEYCCSCLNLEKTKFKKILVLKLRWSLHWKILHPINIKNFISFVFESEAWKNIDDMADDKTIQKSFAKMDVNKDVKMKKKQCHARKSFFFFFFEIHFRVRLNLTNLNKSWCKNIR